MFVNVIFFLLNSIGLEEYFVGLNICIIIIRLNIKCFNGKKEELIILIFKYKYIKYIVFLKSSYYKYDGFFKYILKCWIWSIKWVKWY